MISLFGRQLDIVNSSKDATTFAASLKDFVHLFSAHSDLFMRNSQRVQLSERIEQVAHTALSYVSDSSDSTVKD